MANNEQKKTIPLSTIPTSKLTVILNNFLVNTVNHLNKLSLNVDEKLSEFDKKMNDLEIMTSLFEAKLESLPDEIKSTYPPLQQCNLDDVNPVFTASANVNPPSSEQNTNQTENKEETQNENENKPEEEKNEEEKKEGEGEGEGEGGGEEEQKQGELTPEEDLNQFLNQHNEFQTLFRMLKVGVPIIGAKQKAQLNGLDMDLFNEMIEKAQKVHPNIQ